MRKVSFDIQFHGRTVKNVPTQDEAQTIVKNLGSDWKYEVKLTDYDPYDTPERHEAMRKHAEKVQAIFAHRRELAHAPSYVNTTGVGPT